MVQIGNDWDQILSGEFEKEYYLKLREFLKQEYRTSVVYPSMYDIFNALKYTAWQDARVVILGQDPYHEPDQAHGLSFSVKNGIPKPPSLKNIFKELEQDLGIAPPDHGCLEEWARRGVMLLNTVLTVRQGQANSHKGKGWEIFTDTVIRALNKREEPLVFLLWGSHAKAKAELIDNSAHLILQAAHPSPLSAHNGFWNCRHFSQANAFLKDQYGEGIDWALTK